MKTNEIQIRDPFILTMKEEGMYYMFGTTDKNCWLPPGTGFDCYKSNDLEEWEGPIAAFRPSENFWATKNYWAPEVHAYNGKFYMFATFKADKRYRGTQILVSDSIEGPYEPLTDGPVTPHNWECLDGTLFVDDDGKPWIVFCHEWTQIHNGSICAMPLSPDLKTADGKPVFLFDATEASWVRPLKTWSEEGDGERHRMPAYVTDGPFVHRMADGKLIMLWSSTGDSGYAMGFAWSESGTISGPWIQEEEPLWKKDGGHGMIFRTFDEQLMLTFHSPNKTPDERPTFIEIEEVCGDIRIKT
ncbi:glycoside hydrolase family 43 protein [Pontiellaceae bacterium B12219]|nr:glycoside hydrolase family 43 protein [Pontiellaceae bacterium B12219]